MVEGRIPVLPDWIPVPPESPGRRDRIVPRLRRYPYKSHDHTPSKTGILPPDVVGK